MPSQTTGTRTGQSAKTIWQSDADLEQKVLEHQEKVGTPSWPALAVGGPRAFSPRACRAPASTRSADNQGCCLISVNVEQGQRSPPPPGGRWAEPSAAAAPAAGPPPAACAQAKPRGKITIKYGLSCV